MIPTMIYGTAWKEEATERLVREAIGAGFRAFDSANQRKHYFEEGASRAIVGAIDAGNLARETIFIQSKFTYVGGQDHRLPYDPDARVDEQVRQSFASSLGHFNTTYLDSFLLHGPEGPTGISEVDQEVWREFESLVDEGKVRAIGISNVSAKQIRGFWEFARIKPSFVQNRCYPEVGWDRAAREACRELGIRYQAFSLVRPRWLDSPPVSETARAHGCSGAAAIYAFARQSGMIPLTGTTNRDHMREALASHQVTLSPVELERIAAMQPNSAP